MNTYYFTENKRWPFISEIKTGQEIAENDIQLIEERKLPKKIKKRSKKQNTMNTK